MRVKESFKERSAEATEIIERVIESGWSIKSIAEAVQVNQRQVYRWLRDGTAPHAIMLDGLRRLDAKVASKRR